MKSLQLLFLIIIFVTAGCASTGKHSLEKGDYYQAALEASQHLVKNPSNHKSKDVLKSAYGLAVDAVMTKISIIKNTTTISKNTQIAEEYLKLNLLSNTIRSSHAALEVVPNPERYDEQLKEFLPPAAEEQYNEGIRLMANNKLRDARDAYYAFSKANDFVPGYKDVQNKIGEAKTAATLRVEIQKPIAPNRYQVSSDYFYAHLLKEASKLSEKHFIEFYSSEDVNRNPSVNPHQLIELSFDDFQVGIMHETKDTREIKKDNVKIRDKQPNGEDKPVYGTVKAQFTKYRREVISQGTLLVRVFDMASNSQLDNKHFPGQFVWFNEWATFSGDERALSDEQKSMTKVRPMMPPSEQDLFLEFTKPILDQTTRYIRNQYDSY